MPECHNFPFGSAEELEIVLTQPGTVSCGDIASLHNWLNVTTQAFQLLACAIQEFLDVEVELPGLSGWGLPMVDEGLMPGWPGFDLQQRARGHDRTRGRIGNVWPVGLGHEGPTFHLKGSSLGDIKVPAFPGQEFPGTDPIMSIIQQIDLNFTILQQALDEAGIEIELPPTIVTGSPCAVLDVPGGSAGDAGPGLGIVQQVNDKLEEVKQAIQDAGAGCLESINSLDDGTGNLAEPEWLESLDGSEPVYTSDSITIENHEGDNNIYNFKEPGVTPGTIQTKYDLDWQPLSCGRSGFRVIADYSLTNINTSVATIEMNIYAVHSDHTADQIQALSQINISPGTTLTGTFTFTADPGDFLSTDSVGVHFRAVSGVSGGAGTYVFTNIRLEP
jgi:hypothetical protein